MILHVIICHVIIFLYMIYSLAQIADVLRFLKLFFKQYILHGPLLLFI